MKRFYHAVDLTRLDHVNYDVIYLSKWPFQDLSIAVLVFLCFFFAAIKILICSDVLRKPVKICFTYKDIEKCAVNDIQFRCNPFKTFWYSQSLFCEVADFGIKVYNAPFDHKNKRLLGPQLAAQDGKKYQWRKLLVTSKASFEVDRRNHSSVF